MIIDALFALLFGLLELVLGLLPDFTDPGWADLGDLSGVAHSAGDRAQIVNFFIPLDLLVSVTGVLLAAWVVSYVVKAVLWVYSKVPGKAT